MSRCLKEWNSDEFEQHFKQKIPEASTALGILIVHYSLFIAKLPAFHENTRWSKSADWIALAIRKSNFTYIHEVIYFYPYSYDQ